MEIYQPETREHRIWQSGPDPENSRANMHEVLALGKCFRLVNKEGVAMYEGYIVGKYSGEEPLKEYGLEHGCVSIEYDYPRASLD